MSETTEIIEKQVEKTEVIKDTVFYFHSNMNTELVTKKTAKKVFKLINNELRITIGEPTKTALHNILAQCETSRHRRMTVCGLIKDDKCFIGVAICSEYDNFSKKIGREKAYNEALNNPTDWLTKWKERVNTQFNGNEERAFIAYCKEVAVNSYLNSEEYRRDKSIEKTAKEKLTKIIISKKKWYKKVFRWFYS